MYVKKSTIFSRNGNHLGAYQKLRSNLTGTFIGYYETKQKRQSVTQETLFGLKPKDRKVKQMVKCILSWPTAKWTYQRLRCAGCTSNRFKNVSLAFSKLASDDERKDQVAQ